MELINENPIICLNKEFNKVYIEVSTETYDKIIVKSNRDNITSFDAAQLIFKEKYDLELINFGLIELDELQDKRYHNHSAILASFHRDGTTTEEQIISSFQLNEKGDGL